MLKKGDRVLVKLAGTKVRGEVTEVDPGSPFSATRYKVKYKEGNYNPDEVWHYGSEVEEDASLPTGRITNTMQALDLEELEELAEQIELEEEKKKENIKTEAEKLKDFFFPEKEEGSYLKCECGAKFTEFPDIHSRWCPKGRR